ncbi:hypothetical protein QQF64_018244 [Cirrhinus molitorella]|uniref:Uncharacterized protein n=1 Tax=Cirrhinus molitorella TaxID=172907 RepID=A0ABR3LKY0_9TELE
MEAMLKINQRINDFTSHPYLTADRFCLSIPRRSDLRLSFINIRSGSDPRRFACPLKSTDERNARGIRIGPESRTSRSDRNPNPNPNPRKIPIRIRLYSATDPVLLFARVLDTYPALPRILMWVCGSAA